MNRLRTKDINLGNYENVYDYYGNNKVNPRVARLVHFALDTVFKPDVSAEPGVLDAIHEKHTNNEPILLVANHLRYIDHMIIGAALYQIPELNGFIGNTDILAKAPYFETYISRLINEKMGCIPVWRPKDLKNELPDNADVAEIALGRKQLVGCTTKLSDTCVDIHSQGRNNFGFGEGERSRTEPDKVKDIGAIFGRIACDSWSAGIPLSIAHVAIKYDGDRLFDNRGVNVHFGKLINPAPHMKKNQVTKEIKNELQRSLDLI